MQTTKPSIITLFSLLLAVYGPQPGKISNGNDRSKWNSVVENDVVPVEEGHYVQEGSITVKGEPSDQVNSLIDNS